MSTQVKPSLSNQQIADFLDQSQERSEIRYREQFRREQVAIYKERMKKKAEKKDDNDVPYDEQVTN